MVVTYIGKSAERVIKIIETLRIPMTIVDLAKAININASNIYTYVYWLENADVIRIIGHIHGAHNKPQDVYQSTIRFTRVETFSTFTSGICPCFRERKRRTLCTTSSQPTT